MASELPLPHLHNMVSQESFESAKVLIRKAQSQEAPHLRRLSWFHMQLRSHESNVYEPLYHFLNEIHCSELILSSSRLT